MTTRGRFATVAAVLFGLSCPALAGSGTITVLDSGGTTRTFDVVTDGSGNFVAKGATCDQSAAANCAGVDAGHSLQVAGEGTAGTAAGGVVTVQGVTSMTPVQVSQATASSLNATVIGAGSAGAANAGVETIQGIASMTPVLVTQSAPADPCFASAKSTADFESASSGGSIVAGTSAKNIFVCSVSIVTSAASTISLVEGTGSSVCTSGSPAAVFLNTGTTASNGASFGANGGIQSGSGIGTVAQTATTADNLCVIFSTGNSPTVNVHVSYVKQ